jgi:hypothetical protein
MVMKTMFAALLAAACALAAAQEGAGWTEKPLAFSAFYACAAPSAADGGAAAPLLEDRLDLIRPLRLRLLHDGPYTSREMVVGLAAPGGETVAIHFYFSGFQNGTYTLETAPEGHPSPLFENCGGAFRMYPLEGSGSTVEFVLYNERGRAADGIYAAFDIDSSLLHY